MIILGIETSCDDTCAAIVEIKKGKVKILSNIVSSQIKIHAPYGGVVPMLASRAHLENIIPVLDKAIKKSKKSFKDIDLISVTRGPGLMPALVVGLNAARALSYVWKKPIVEVNHIEGHLLINWLLTINEKPKTQNPKLQTNPKFRIKKTKQIKFPIICLVVSGGHTQLILMKQFGEYKIIGETLDDAAGEAFDKVARILGLDYPGGPAIFQQSKKWKSKISNLNTQSNLKFQYPNFINIKLPRPMINSNNFDFSFSGLKTAVLYSVKNLTKKYSLEEIRGAMSFEFQEAVIDVLTFKAIKAAEKYEAKTIMFGGGVAANNELQKRFKKECRTLKINFSCPPKKFCTDNGTMIALAGYYNLDKKIENILKI